MKYLITLLTLSILVPGSAFAATFAGDRSLTLSEPVADNAYLGGTNIAVTAALPADLSALGGGVRIYAPIGGDLLAAAGTVEVEQPVAGDVRVAGGKVSLNNSVGGDIAAAGGAVSVMGAAKNISLFGGTLMVNASTTGPVTLYGADISLTGDVGGDVDVIASDRFILGEGTHINGRLRYNAPQQLVIPSSAVIDGGVVYTGSYSYVPTNEEARTFALAGAGLFFIVRALAALIVAGLVAGLFPRFADAISAQVLARRKRSVVLSVLLGFALIIATPLLVLLLLVSFAGAGVALLLGSAYLLAVVLAYVATGIIAGAALRQNVLYRISGNHTFSWRDAVLGTILLYFISTIPYVGSLVTFVLALAALGSLATLAYEYAFRAEDSDLV